MHRITRALVVVGLVVVSCGLCLAQEGGPRERPRGGAEGGRGRREFRLPEEFREFVEKVAPGRLEQIEQLRRTDPARMREVMMDLMRQKRRLDELKERDPAAYERTIESAQLEREARDMAEAARGTENEEEKTVVKEKLAEVISRLFDIQCENYEREIAEQTKRLEDMKKLLEKRRAAKEKIVKRRVDELTGDDDVLRWDPSPRRGPGRRPEAARRGPEAQQRGREGQARPFMRR